MPFLGILDTKEPHRVPGTIVLNEEQAHSEALTSGLKHGTGKNSHILLSPQPSNDPNDPLNWPRVKKILCVLIIFWGSAMYGGTVGPLLNTGLYVIAAEFDTSVSAVVILSSYQLLVVGLTGPIISALARKWGKRPLMLASGVFSLIGSIVGSCSHEFDTLRAARIIQGFGVAAYESLVFPVIGDLFFVHERGPYLAVGNFVLAGVANLCGIVTGSITNNLGWKYLFHLLAILGGTQLLCQFLFVPETSFVRSFGMGNSEVVDAATAAAGGMVAEKHISAEQGHEQEHAEIASAPVPTSEPRAKKSFFQELALYTGCFSDENLVQLIVAPFAVCINLAALWFVVLPGVFITLYVAIAYVLPQIFAVAPYNMNSQSIGYLSLGSFIGGILASSILGLLNDPMIKWATRRNHGVYEPEYRLLPLILGLVVGAGLMGFGVVSQEGYSPTVAATMYGITLFGIMIAIIPSAGYMLDAYSDLSHEAFIANMTFKNLLIYGFSYFVNDWTASAGPATVFYVLGGIAFALILTAPLIYVFGKQYRSYWYGKNILGKLHITTHSEI